MKQRSEAHGAVPKFDRLDQVDRLIDWDRFERYFRWLDTSDSECAGCSPMVLFKAMLLQQWFALNAVEFDFDVRDRRSFREFIGVGPNDKFPTHEMICGFRRILVERKILQGVFGEIRVQLMGNRSGATERRHDGMDTAGRPAELIDPIESSDVLGPTEWKRLENALVTYWRSKRQGMQLPSLGDIKLTEVPELQPYFTLVRVSDDGRFRYEFVGSEIERANAGRLTNVVLDDKHDDNLGRFGHAGLQGELLALCRRTMTRRCPVTTSTFFTNAAGVKCQLWTVQAPLVNADRQVTMLIGAALIKAVTIN